MPLEPPPDSAGSGEALRRSLDQLGGDLEWEGEAEPAALLVEAWKAARSGPADTLTHGFHTYPARLHPAVAAHVLDAWLARRVPRSGPPPGVLDPFCGSGTVLVECTARGLPSVGVDLNPLAVRLSRLKCELRSPEPCERLMATARAVTEASLEHVRARDNVRAPLPRSEVAWYAPHVLKELAGLWLEIGKVGSQADREALTLVFSSLVVKFSKQRADTSEIAVDKRLRKGLASEFFLRKCRELVERWGALRGRVAGLGAPAGAGRPTVLSGDARTVDRLLPDRLFEFILSSPPYGGTYDYVQHQARRFPWLGIDPTRFDRNEIGARRQVADQDDGLETWNRDLTSVLVALRRVAAPNAHLVLVMGDTKWRGHVVPATAQLKALAPDCGWRFVAAASEPRVDWHGEASRREHLVQFTTDQDAPG